MPREFNRAERVSAAISRHLAVIIRGQMNDPRIDLITINEVVVSRDLSIAKIYITALGSAEQQQQATAVLNHASGFLRSQLAAVLRMRKAPGLRFLYDESAQRGDRLLALIERNHEQHQSTID